MTYRGWNTVNRPAGTDVLKARRLFFSVSSPSEACAAISILKKRHREELRLLVTDEFGMKCLTPRGWQERHDQGRRRIRTWCEGSGDPRKRGPTDRQEAVSDP